MPCIFCTFFAFNWQIDGPNVPKWDHFAIKSKIQFHLLKTETHSLGRWESGEPFGGRGSAPPDILQALKWKKDVISREMGANMGFFAYFRSILLPVLSTAFLQILYNFATCTKYEINSI